MEYVRTAAEFVAYVIEGVAVLVIAIGTGQALWHYFTRAVPKQCEHREMARSRMKLGDSLSLGLEFLIGADVLKTAVAPSWTAIGHLAAIVGLRTVLNFFLMRELEHEERSIAARDGRN
jgi:uncharacterized membrane protein